MGARVLGSLASRPGILPRIAGSRLGLVAQRGEKVGGSPVLSCLLEGVGQREEPRFAEGGSEEGNTDGQAVDAARGHGDVRVP